MLPHSYTVDSLSQSQDLASAVLAASTPSKIGAACASIESFLHSHTPDQSRHFFSIAFPTLICKLFGFGDSAAPPPPPSQSLPPPNGWIDAVLASNDSDLAATVFSLLSPNGTLMSTISAVDKLALVKYVFPIERLPEWARSMLSSEKDCRVLSDLCPLFKGKIQEDPIKGSSYEVRLNVFEYYMFWFAYYPVCRGNNENSVRVSMKRSKKFRLESWASSIRGFSGSSKRDPEQKLECNLYLRLLYAYLQAFVPVFDLTVHQPYRSSLLHYGYGYDGSVMMRAEFLVNVFVHYWLVDNDFSPFPVSVAKSFGIVFPFHSVLEETPPASGLEEVVKLFVKYLNLSWVTSGDGHENYIEYSESPRCKTPSLGSFDVANLRSAASVSPIVQPLVSWNTYVQRPLYRFILRTFLFCPLGSSIKNASQVFSVWVTYMEPWSISLDDFSELDAVVNASAKDVKKESESRASGYTSSWQSYVISNYVYYSSLIMHFIGFAHKFLHTDPEIVTQMVLKVMNVLTSSKELMDLIRKVDSVFHSKQTGLGKSMLNSLSRYVPSIREQLKDWEDGLSESDADGSFLHANWNKDLRLFSDGEDGGQQLLQLFILRAEAELQAISGNNLSQVLECIDSLKATITKFFGGDVIRPISFSLEPDQPQRRTRDELFKPRRVGNQAVANIKYKGDWMNRPISEDEVAWLAKLLVQLSYWLNERLGLNHPENKDAEPKLSYVEISDDVRNVTGPAEAVKIVLLAIGSWLAMVGVSVLRVMRRHGVRVNLRVLASKKFLMLLLMYALFCMLKKALRMVW